MKRGIRKSKPEGQTSSGSVGDFDLTGLRSLETDILVPTEFQAVYSRRVLSAEEELMAAVLEQGVADFQRYATATEKSKSRLFADANAWIGDKNSAWTFSFVNCCEVIGIEPDSLRQGLLRWQRRAAEASLRTKPSFKRFHKAAA
jgi:hypothetical protein